MAKSESKEKKYLIMSGIESKKKYRIEAGTEVTMYDLLTHFNQSAIEHWLKNDVIEEVR